MTAVVKQQGITIAVVNGRCWLLFVMSQLTTNQQGIVIVAVNGCCWWLLIISLLIVCSSD